MSYESVICILATIFIIAVIVIYFNGKSEYDEAVDDLNYIDGIDALMEKAMFSEDQSAKEAIIEAGVIECRQCLRVIEYRFIKRWMPWLYNQLAIRVSEIRHRVKIIANVTINIKGGL